MVKTNKLALIICLVVFLSAFAGSATAQYAQRSSDNFMLLKVDNVKGSSKFPGYEKWIPISSWSMGYNSNEQSTNVTKNYSPAESVQPLYIAMEPSAYSSSGIMRAAIENQMFSTVTLAMGVMTGSGEDRKPQVLFRITLYQVPIPSVNIGASFGSDSQMEQVSFDFQSGTYEYFELDENEQSKFVSKVSFSKPKPVGSPARKTTIKSNRHAPSKGVGYGIGEGHN